MGNYQTIFTENFPQIEAEKMLVVEDFLAYPQTCLVHSSYFYIYALCAIFRDDVCVSNRLMCTLVDEMIVSKVWTVKQLSLYRRIYYHKGTIVNYLQQKKNWVVHRKIRKLCFIS